MRSSGKLIKKIKQKIENAIIILRRSFEENRRVK